MASDIYSLDFNPNILSSKQEELGLSFADDDTAVELMKQVLESQILKSLII